MARTGDSGYTRGLMFLQFLPDPRDPSTICLSYWCGCNIPRNWSFSY